MPSPLKILIAEDSRVIRNLLYRFFTKRGHQVDLAEDGEAALLALRADGYDVALLDFHLPKVDGLRVVASIKSENRSARLPYFVALTADVKGLFAHPENRQTFDLAIAKPIDVVQLCQVIESLQEFVGCQNEEMHQTPVISADALSRDKEQRAYRRATIGSGTTAITLTDGSSYGCKVLNLSLGGAAVEVEVRPPIGEQVMLGHTEARIVRHTENGLALEFTRKRSQ
jgi:CheY-like chemotaxis protein